MPQPLCDLCCACVCVCVFACLCRDLHSYNVVITPLIWNLIGGCDLLFGFVFSKTEFIKHATVAVLIVGERGVNTVVIRPPGRGKARDGGGGGHVCVSGFLNIGGGLRLITASDIPLRPGWNSHLCSCTLSLSHDVVTAAHPRSGDVCKYFPAAKGGEKKKILSLYS